MSCGRKVVNGKGATIFSAVYCILAFAGIVVLYLNAPKLMGTSYEWVAHYEMLISVCLIISMWLIPKLVNAFFFRLAPAIRIDAVK